MKADEDWGLRVCGLPPPPHPLAPLIAFLVILGYMLWTRTVERGSKIYLQIYSPSLARYASRTLSRNERVAWWIRMTAVKETEKNTRQYGLNDHEHLFFLSLFVCILLSVWLFLFCFLEIDFRFSWITRSALDFSVGNRWPLLHVCCHMESSIKYWFFFPFTITRGSLPSQLWALSHPNFLILCDLQFIVPIL